MPVNSALGQTSPMAVLEYSSKDQPNDRKAGTSGSRSPANMFGTFSLILYWSHRLRRCL